MNLPEQFVAEMKRILGESGFAAYEEALAKPAKYGLRINTLKADPEELAKALPFDLRPVPFVRNGFYYSPKEQPSRHPFYSAGLYYLQEPSAMTPASVLPVSPGERVLDLCAAPGGKSTELAAKLCGEGLLVSNDISASRCKALLKNLELFGVENAVILCEDPKKLAGRFPSYYDKILVDAPCSGEGMFRREKKMIPAWKEHGPSFFSPVQRSILSSAVQMLRPGGMLLYSTCTFSAEEDEGTVAHILASHPKMSLVEIDSPEGFREGMPGLLPAGVKKLLSPERLEQICFARRIFPHCVEGEGHFLALFRKENDTAGGLSLEDKTALPSGKTKLPVELTEFLHLLGRDDKKTLSRVALWGEKAVLLPEGTPDLSGLRVIRSGLLLGECKKNRFEPSQALAMTFKKGVFPNELDLPVSDERVARYLKGETIEAAEHEMRGKNGWILVLADGYPLGFAKRSGSSLKNKYLPGWRIMS